MSQLSKFIAAHPLNGRPYDRLEFVRCDGNGAPLYKVMGCNEAPTGAFTALGKAFERFGGKCFYCPTRFRPQPLANDPTKAHRDHVIAVSNGGSQLLHNLVIACGKCGRTKANDAIHDFRPKSAKEYLAALNRHIEECLGEIPGLQLSSDARDDLFR